MKKVKRGISAILAICLCFAMLTVPVFADTETEVTRWKSSDYLNPDSPVTENNPWSVETTNNADMVWQTVTNTTPSTAVFALFPMFPDGVTPTTGYVTTGDINNKWGDNGVNTAVNGKYMVPGGFWTNDEQTTRAKVAKVFTAPKTGKIKIIAAATLGAGSEGLIVPQKVDEPSWESDANLYWSVEKNGTEIWKKDGTQRVTGALYDSVQFDDMTLEVTEGDKIYFILQPRKWANPRSSQACMWDPVVKYELADGTFEDEPDTGLPVEDTDRFLSSKYLDPEKPYINNPWSVETTNNLNKTWETVTGTVPSVTNPAFDLFPVMPDGNKPTTAYVHTGKSTSPGWTVDAYNAAVNGKYMMPAAFYEASKDYLWCSTTDKIAKVFTAPEAGIVKITAAATNGENTEGLIATGKSLASWDRDSQAFIVTKNETEIWNKAGSALVNLAELANDECKYIEFETQYVEVKEGDKLYFAFDACNWTDRQTQIVMWDPVVTYVSRNVMGDASYANGTVTVDIMAVDATFDSHKKLIVGAFDGEETLLGATLVSFGELNVDNNVTITGLTEKPAVVRVFVWDFGADENALTPVDAVVERVPASAE